jgi:hypothetical protein
MTYAASESLPTRLRFGRVWCRGILGCHKTWCFGSARSLPYVVSYANGSLCVNIPGGDATNTFVPPEVDYCETQMQGRLDLLHSQGAVGGDTFFPGFCRSDLHDSFSDNRQAPVL